MKTVTFYTKPNCPLCDKALEQVELARRVVPFELREVNILSDRVLYERYKHAIPVGCVGGVELFRYRVAAEDLVKALTEDRGQK